MDNWQTFTTKIAKARDIDPGYTAMYESDFSQDKASRFCLAWMSFYQLGIAARASELKGPAFYRYLRSQYATAKRNSERRHFRGAAGLNALADWQERWPQPENFLPYVNEKSNSYFDVKKKMDPVAMMGPYMTWKACDLVSIVYFNDLDMDGSAKHSPDVPRKAALRMFPKLDVEDAYDEIVMFARTKKLMAHPHYEWPFGIREAESIACVYKQMMSGSYIYGARTAKALASLRATESDTAQHMAKALLRHSPYKAAELLEEILPAAVDAKKDARRRKAATRKLLT